MTFIGVKKAFIHSKEKALQESLSQMRAAIHQYTKDKHKPPQTLDDLVIAGYLKAIPQKSIHEQGRDLAAAACAGRYAYAYRRECTGNYGCDERSKSNQLLGYSLQ
jgi:hypothetical protein